VPCCKRPLSPFYVRCVCSGYVHSLSLSVCLFLRAPLVYLCAPYLGEIFSFLYVLMYLLGILGQPTAALAVGIARFSYVLKTEWPTIKGVDGFGLCRFAGGSWVPELIRMAGGTDVLGQVDQAVQFVPQQLVQQAPDIVVFALCGYKMEAAASQAEIALEQLHGLWDSVAAFRYSPCSEGWNLSSLPALSSRLFLGAPPLPAPLPQTFCTCFNIVPAS
jgi:hypothetical protein